MTLSGRDNAPLTLKLDQLKPVHELRAGVQELSPATCNTVESDIPMSPLSVSPPSSARADDAMSEVSIQSPYTPFMAMSPPSGTPQKPFPHELESPTGYSPSSPLSFDPFIQSPESRVTAPTPTTKANFRAKAKGLSFKLPSLPDVGSMQNPGLLNVVRQSYDVSPLPSPLARDLRRRVEAHGQDAQVEADITSYDDGDDSFDSIFDYSPGTSPLKSTKPEPSCLGLDLGLPTPQTEGHSSDRSSYLDTNSIRNEPEPAGTSPEIDYAGARIMEASLARSASAELVPSYSQARQTRMMATPQAPVNLSKSSSKKYPRRSIPLPQPHLQSPFSSTPSSTYVPGPRSLPSSPEEVIFKRDVQVNGLRSSPSISRFFSRSPLSPSPKRTPAHREAHNQLGGANLLQPQLQGCALFPKYFPEGYLLEPNFARQYCLETELGAGGYGFVLGARNVHTGQQVAVKFINRRSLPSRGLIRDYKNDIVPLEAVVLQLAEHPGVVGFYGLYEDAFYFYLVQELHGSPWSKNTKNKHKSDQESADTSVQQHGISQADVAHSKPSSPYAPVNSSPLRPLAASSSMPSIPTLGRLASPPFCQDVQVSSSPRGSTHLVVARPNMPRRASYDLFECIEQHERLSEGQAKYIFAQVVETVWYLDSIGITHRDIKDENLVIDREFKVKFIDFGSAVIRDVRKPPPTYTSFFGTVTFASPEILKNLPYTAPPAEVWTLGILLSFLVTGQSPFPTTEHAKCAMMCEPHESIVVSPACGDLMRKCLHPDPMRRHTIQQVRDHPWLRGALERA